MSVLHPHGTHDRDDGTRARRLPVRRLLSRAGSGTGTPLGDDAVVTHA